jgi:hypothetical protein
MKYLLLLLFVGCASPGYKRHNMANVKYTVREYYLPSEPIKTVEPILSKPKPKKTLKKAKKVDCGRVFTEINQCMR